MDFARWDTILIHHETDEKNQRFRLLGCEGGPDFRTWADVVVLGWLNTEYVSR